MYDDSDRADVHDAAAVVARKPQVCGECHRTIEPRETYERVKMLYDGHWSTEKTCAHCLAAREWIAQICSGWVYGSVGEDLQEHMYEGYACLALGRLVIGIRRKWMAGGELIPVERVREWRVAAVEKVPREYRGAA